MPLAIPSEYNHFEGALAISHRLPTLVLAEADLQQRGIVYPGGGQRILTLPERDAGAHWLESATFTESFRTWCNAVKARRQVFLGCASARNETAGAISRYLESLGVSVFDRWRDLTSDDALQADAESALASSATSIFLFGSNDSPAARGTLLFQLGYFARAKGQDRSLIICEAGVELPTELVGGAVVALVDRTGTDAMRSHLRAFVHTRL